MDGDFWIVVQERTNGILPMRAGDLHGYYDGGWNSVGVQKDDLR